MAGRVAPGGASNLTLGDEDPRENFLEHAKQRAAVAATPDALPRFPQAPGGTSSVCIGGDDGASVVSASVSDLTRVAIGGTATICLGSDDAQQDFAERQREREAHLQTPEAVPRFPQAPGGTQTIILGGDPQVGEFAAPGNRPVGGASTLCMGDEDSVARFPAPQVADMDVPMATARFPQAPGGDASISLGGGAPICIGGDDMTTPLRPVGGTASIDLAATTSSEPDVAPRGPVGGHDSVLLGSHAGVLRSEYQTAAGSEFATPEAAARFPQAPGGESSLALGASEAQVVAPRGPVGGATTYAFGEAADPSEGALSVRGPVGGAATVCFGDSDAVQDFAERMSERARFGEAPDALQRFTQAPGGDASVILGGGVIENTHVTRGAVGGETTISLGSETSGTVSGMPASAHAPAAWSCESHRLEPIDTPEAVRRFAQAPGGDSTLVMGAAEDGAASARGPVGGASTVVLGDDDSAQTWRSYDTERRQVLETPEAAVRFAQAPGGTSTLVLGAADAATGAVRGPVGGEDAVVLGGDDAAETWRSYDAERLQAPAPTPDAKGRFPQAPGGTSTVVLGGAVALATPVRGNPGGESTLVLGEDDPREALDSMSANLFASNSSQNCGNALTDRRTTRVCQAPGGESTIVLGDDPQSPRAPPSTRASPWASPAPGSPARRSARASPEPSSARRPAAGATPNSRPPVQQSPGGNSQVLFGGNYPNNASDYNPNRVTPGRQPFRILQSPGGASTLRLGEAPSLPSMPAFPGTSSNKFANGASQNCGNILTDRPTTRVQQTPGGTSTVVLGGDENADVINLPVSTDEKDLAGSLLQSPGDKHANSAVGDENANVINVRAARDEKDRPSTRVQQTPGGASTVSLG